MSTLNRLFLNRGYSIINKLNILALINFILIFLSDMIPRR
jgi:hypothetical protein